MPNINFDEIFLPSAFRFKHEGSNIDYLAVQVEGKNGFDIHWNSPSEGKPVRSFYSRENVEGNILSGLWKMEKDELKEGDVINQPSHYHQNGIDVIAFSEAQFSKDELRGFYRINCLKYITRFDRKNGAEDLKKGLFYLNKLLEMEESK